MIIGRYLAVTFLRLLAMLLAGLGSLAFLIDMAELVRRASDEQIPLPVLVVMGLSKLPALLEKILPFLLLLAALLGWQRLSRRYEMTALRASGFSVWQLLQPMMLCAAAIGCLHLLLLNPAASILLGKYEQLENRYFRGGDGASMLPGGGLWLRQPSTSGAYYLLHAADVDVTDNSLQRVMVLQFNSDKQFTQRLDAPNARLQDGYWRMAQGWRSLPGRAPEKLDDYRLPTQFTSARLQGSFRTPQTLSVWELPAFVRQLKESGFPALRHELHWHTLLASPLLYAALMMVAAAFAGRHPRHGKLGLWLFGGVLAGFGLYILSDFIGALGISGRMPLLIAAWAPAALYALGAATILVYTEEG